MSFFSKQLMCAFLLPGGVFKMNDRNFKRHMAYEVIVVLCQLALLTYITRLWPILLLIILGILIASLRLLFLSAKKIDPVRPLPQLPAPVSLPSEKDMRSMTFLVIQNRITQILQGKYPDARWIWENPRAREDILAGNPVYILLNRAGGYRRGRVVIRNLQVLDVVFEEPKTRNEPSDPSPSPAAGSTPPIPPTPSQEDEALPENFGLIAFQWVEAHIMELNDCCNESIAEGLSEYLIPADILPVSDSWEEICKELVRNDIHGAQCCDDGILIEFEQ